jgi:phosphohistidine phosphatase
VKLYVMRHGPAEEHAAGGDSARPLTVSGRDRVRDVARALLAHGEAPRIILSSPLVRAMETAEIVHAECKLEAPIVTRRELAMGGRGLELVKECVAAGKKRVMLVGHQPDLSGLVEDVAGFSVEMQKAMVVSISVKPESLGKAPHIRFILDPKTLQFTRV